MATITNSLAPAQQLVASTQMPILTEMMAPIIITGEPITQAYEETTLLVDSTPYTPRTVAQWPTKTINGSIPTHVEISTEYQSLGSASPGAYATDTKPPMPTVFRYEFILQKVEASQKEDYPSEEDDSIHLRNRLAATKCRRKNQDEADSLEVLARELEPKNHYYLIQTKTERRDDVYYLKNEILHRSECDSDLIQDYLLDEAEYEAKRGTTKTIPKRTGTAKTPRTLKIAS
ncbi:unnamed protein product [Clonostachys rosea f. rosea IK726]|jgi:hypothetical protein|uniref:Uncharacterized protein n=1 Tax=Clonostachys rosea f. rosea IK726 TaxID=1349383 RepID=A0ACA9TWW7_BIOOC|nr:unnamed protein product [Clonostachys rosea f. rosea IK726]